jgi:signal transduction histidine kinase
MELGCADRGATVVDIEDDGGVPGRAAPMDGLGSGHGLLGLAERLRVFGGTLQYGPTSSGGWRVTATLPGSREGESDE